MRVLQELVFVATALALVGVAERLAAAEPQEQVIETGLRHLRVDGPREWAEFPVEPDGNGLVVHFSAKRNENEHTLRLRQQDVKQVWEVRLNGTRLGALHRDENDMVVYFAVPPGTLADGENTLRIAQAGAQPTPDDIRAGEIALIKQPVRRHLASATVDVEVLDGETGSHLPSRVTVLNEDEALCTVGAESNDHLAVRPGTVYTSTGKARFGLPPGRYSLYAGRGFEYSLDRAEVVVRAGEEVRKTLRIRREVPTSGYAACDTHIHSLTHSGHGDSTDRERVITLAGEGIELPIFTDHNVAIDYEPVAREMNVRQYFTPVIGNEVTTRVGHFNVFPIRPNSRQPDPSHTDWSAIFDQIYATPGVKVAILNHARDVHGGTRPFGPKLHLDVVGENVEGWDLRADGMEVINSSATQSDVLQLFHDWMGLLNRGFSITPVGSSDSHDVARHFVGQGRTYIRCDDSDPARIDVDEAVASFLAGRVMVSYGLLTEVTVSGEPASGEVVPLSDDRLEVSMRILGPSWTSARRLLLYSNGTVLREFEIPDVAARPLPSGVKWQGDFVLPKPDHDVHLVAIALGPGIEMPYWKTAKPYQRTSPAWQAHVVGCSGAVWIDADGDGKATPAREYATRLVEESAGDVAELVDLLNDYDEAVAAQAAHLIRQQGGDLRGPIVQAALENATQAVQAGFRRYLDAWRRSEMARVAN